MSCGSGGPRASSHSKGEGRGGADVEAMRGYLGVSVGGECALVGRWGPREVDDVLPRRVPVVEWK